MKEDEQIAALDFSSVSIGKIRPGEYDVVVSLRPHPWQTSYVATNEASLKEAAENPACVPLLIRAGGEPVGFAMYALDEDDGNYWIYRLMIDARHQGRGYGRAALTQIVEALAKLPDCSCVVLGVKPENEQARRLYERFGFRPTGAVIEGETVMKYEL